MAEEYKATINLNGGKTTGQSTSKKDKSFAGGLTGGLIGGLLGGLKSLLKPLQAIDAILSVALFPLLKSFLILFLKIGIMLHKFLSKVMGTTSSVKGITGTNEEGGTVIGEMGKKLALWGAIIVGAVAGIAAAFLGAPALLIAAIVGAVVLLTKPLIEFGMWVGAKLADAVIFLGEKLYEGIQWIGDKLISAGQWLSDKWDSAVEGFNNFLENLKGFGTWAWEGLKKVFSDSWESLKNFGTTIGDSLSSVLSTSFEALSGIGQWIRDKITGFWDGIKSVGSYIGSAIGINDGIVTPNGNVIRTNPSDYIIATKDPSSLGGGNSSSNINVTINGGLITEDVARDIGKIMMRELNLGGGF